MKLHVGIVVGFIVLLFMVAGGCRTAKKEAHEVVVRKADSTVVKVVAALVEERSYEEWGSYSADLRGIEDANLTGPYQGGKVGSVRAVGSWAAKGDALCDIDSERYGIALEAANAQVVLARGELDRARINVEKGSIGRSALDAANLAYQNARMLQVTARRAFEDCRCESPFDGIVVSRSIEKHQMVAPGTSTIRISRLDRLEAVIAIPEAEAFSYREGMMTEFTLLQSPDTIFEGKLASIDKAVDQSSRTVAARVLVTNRNNILRPGMVGRARILRATHDKAIVIPSTALLHLENGISVMVIENGVARQHTVLTGTSSGDSTLVIRGLERNDLLVVTGGFQISDGTKVSY